MRIAIGLLAILSLIVAGCVRESDEDTNEGTNPSPGQIAIEVLVTDEAIEMPAEFSGGGVLFEVTNNGSAEHGFAIEGVDEQLDKLGIDELDTLSVELEPGTYTVYSPVEGDREAGLETQVTVTEEAAESGAPLRDDAVDPSEQQAPAD